jgi:hypothetical protein
MTFTNEGTWDRVIRILKALAFGYAGRLDRDGRKEERCQPKYG